MSTLGCYSMALEPTGKAGIHRGCEAVPAMPKGPLQPRAVASGRAAYLVGGGGGLLLSQFTYTHFALCLHLWTWEAVGAESRVAGTPRGSREPCVREAF